MNTNQRCYHLKSLNWNHQQRLFGSTVRNGNSWVWLGEFLHIFLIFLLCLMDDLKLAYSRTTFFGFTGTKLSLISRKCQTEEPLPASVTCPLHLLFYAFDGPYRLNVVFFAHVQLLNLVFSIHLLQWISKVFSPHEQHGWNPSTTASF